MDRYVASFRLSITQALGDQLAQQLDLLTPRPLTADALNSMDQQKGGVYVLHHQSQQVYVGKAKNSLPTRLRKHLNKLRGRVGLDAQDITFIALYVEEDLDAVAPEKLLINRLRRSGPAGILNGA